MDCIYKNLKIVLFVGLILLGSFQSAWGVQSHGGAEGLVSHEIGHIFFLGGLIFLLFKAYQAKIEGTGWAFFRIFLWLLVGWNIMTFSGHWMREFVDLSKFQEVEGVTTFFTATSFFDFVFYLTWLDHLLLVPAFCCLYLALRAWRREG